jgi:predicted AAA+ superfamily ATPase
MFKRWLQITLNVTSSALILGPRRSGKTTLLRKRFPDLNYCTLDDLDALSWAEKDPKGLVNSLGEAFIIDEVQRCPMLTVAVKYVIDNLGARALLTGSSSIGLLDSTAESLAGRIEILYLPTACWGEDTGPPQHGLLQSRPSIPLLKQGARLLEEAVEYGGFPEVLCQPQKEMKRKILTNYRNTYFTRDLMQLANIENLNALMGIFHHLARSIGSSLDVSNFAREAGVSFQTAKKYLGTLHQAQLSFKLHGYHGGPAKRFLKSAKTYFADMGILQSLPVKLSEGQLLENFVLAELEKRRKLGMIPAERFFYYKSTGGSEVDLVFEIQDTVYAVEIKSTVKPGPGDVRNLRSFARQLPKPCRLLLFYRGDEYRRLDDVQLIPVAALYRCGGL